MPSASRPEPSTERSEPFADFTDLAGFYALPRVMGLALSPDGARLVAAVQQPDSGGSRYVSALWQLDPTGAEAARRLTFSAKGESAPRFGRDGDLFFSSARPDPQGDDDADGVAALWRLPAAGGEATLVAQAPGGISLAGIADDGTLLATTSVLAGGSLADDAERRKDRKAKGITAILHTGMPIRYWDKEIGDVSPRLVTVRPSAEPGADWRLEPADLTPRADTLALHNADADLSPDGRTAATTWKQRVRGGETTDSVVLVDTTTRKRTPLLAGTKDVSYGGPRFAPDGRSIAVLRVTASTPTDTAYDFLEVHRLDESGRALTGDPVAVEVGDLTVTEYRWSADSQTLFVAGDLHSRGAIIAVDPQTGQVQRTVADDAVYGSLQPSPDGRYVYALRSTIDSPARPVRLTVKRASAPVEIPAPGSVGALPGTLEWVETTVGELTVGGWLLTPKIASAKSPAPLMVWVHGGPHGSYNAWSWRWCPWLAVARGYAVLMPDPAMSTGYGHAGLNRGWPRLPDVVWGEVEALADSVLSRRRTLDADRTALLGASFGGFMTNWIAGHTDRFKAIVTHAGLWALDQQHATTDAAAHKVRVHGLLEDLPEWYAAYSPHRHVAAISTPMLVTHGNKDYRVPVSEALRLWWDLVSHWKGTPASMPHRFLQLTSENHWVLAPGNAVVWNQVVLGFCDQHVLGKEADPALDQW